MGKIFAEIELSNTLEEMLARKGKFPKEKIKKMMVNMLVDSGAYNLAINENIKNQLDLDTIDEQIFELADGSHQSYKIVGPIDIRFENRYTTVRAVLLPGNAEPLLGQIPLEDLDVILLPKEEKMIINPRTPLIARKELK